MQALNNMLEDKNIVTPLNLVAHGFITGQYAVTWALAHPDAIAKLVLIDVPTSPEVRVSGLQDRVEADESHSVMGGQHVPRLAGIALSVWLHVLAGSNKFASYQADHAHCRICHCRRSCRCG